jgi:nitroimidazol reductase NimA-like FMN-containing flavoprotein (pyridoxamine 5'-phosphate oxidase superfamily)
MGSRETYTGVELSAAESWTLLRQAVVGRLAVIVDDRPEIFPVNHVVDRDSLLFRTGTGTKLAGAVGHLVAFEADAYDVDTASAWSVVVKGQAQEVNRLYDVQDVFELPLFPWHSAPKPFLIRIEPDSISGRRFEVTGRARSAVPFVPPRRAADE